MTTTQNKLPVWILIVSGLFAIMELGVSASMIVSPDWLGDKVDLSAKGMDFLVHMWAIRQFALGCILTFATLKRSVPMLQLAFIFLVVMFLGDLWVGLSRNDNSFVGGSVMMALFAGLMLFFISKRKTTN